MAWRLAKSLTQMRADVNSFAPHRDKSSDGAIGNEEHASRSSDHNAWVNGPPGVVTAIDITDDPAGGFSAEAFVKTLLNARDDRVKYIIWNRKIYSGFGGPSPWKGRAYKLKNPHTHHTHISVKVDEDHYDDPSPWRVDPAAHALIQEITPFTTKLPILVIGTRGKDVEALQRRLGFTDAQVDGIFGKKTQAAVITAQRRAKIVADGVVGPYTWDILKPLALRARRRKLKAKRRHR